MLIAYLKASPGQKTFSIPTILNSPIWSLRKNFFKLYMEKKIRHCNTTILVNIPRIWTRNPQGTSVIMRGNAHAHAGIHTGYLRLQNLNRLQDVKYVYVLLWNCMQMRDDSTSRPIHILTSKMIKIYLNCTALSLVIAVMDGCLCITVAHT